MQISIDRSRDGRTVLDIVKKELRISTKTLAMLKRRENGITVNGRRVTVRYLLREGDILSLDLATSSDEENDDIIPIKLALDILYEDESIIALNKPPFMPTHPSHGHFCDTLANAVCFHVKEELGEPFVFRAISRLDRNTSGIVLLAKDKYSAGALCRAMRSGEFSKEYIAVLSGTPTPTEGRIETYIRRREESIITREVCEASESASIAVTLYETISAARGLAVVRAHPITGRTHQLRVHFAHIGHPIVGDDLYGESSELIARQALHAYSLSFPHPVTGERMRIKAPLPKDMSELIENFEVNI